MNSLYIVSKHILYNVGGAEKSILKYADKLDFDKKTLLGFEYKNKQPLETTQYDIQFLNPFLKISKFYFFEYFVNKFIIRRQLKKISVNHIISYGIYFPEVINNTNNCFKELHIRSETDIGIFKNYNSGVKYILKKFLKALESPFEYLYKKELKRAILTSDKVVCNSIFMQTKLFKLYGKNSEVIYPEVSITKDGFETSKEAIVFIGDSIIKGLNIVKDIAKKLPKHDFYIFGRNNHKEIRKKNIIYCPWENDILNIYKRAKLVIVPSQWEEAYGRVAKESILLDIPVLVSDIGGLKEAVDYDENKLVKDYTIVDEWVRSIKQIL